MAYGLKACSCHPLSYYHTPASFIAMSTVITHDTRFTANKTQTLLSSVDSNISNVFSLFSKLMQDLEAELSHTKISNAILRSTGL